MDDWVYIDGCYYPKNDTCVLATVQYGESRYVTKAFYIGFLTRATDYDYDGDSDYCEDKDEYYWPEGWYSSDHHELTQWQINGNEKVIAWMDLPKAYDGDKNE
jgi:hypothetical protein